MRARTKERKRDSLLGAISRNRRTKDRRSFRLVNRTSVLERVCDYNKLSGFPPICLASLSDIRYDKARRSIIDYRNCRYVVHSFATRAIIPAIHGPLRRIATANIDYGDVNSLPRWTRQSCKSVKRRLLKRLPQFGETFVETACGMLIGADSLYR